MTAWPLFHEGTKVEAMDWLGEHIRLEETVLSAFTALRNEHWEPSPLKLNRSLKRFTAAQGWRSIE